MHIKQAYNIIVTETQRMLSDNAETILRTVINVHKYDREHASLGHS